MQYLETKETTLKAAGRLRAALRERARDRCESCGSTDEESLTAAGRRLSPHRLIPHANGEIITALESVQLLCGVCHKAHHEKQSSEAADRQGAVSRAVTGLLIALGADPQDQNFIETPRRLTAYLLEHFTEPDSVELEEAEEAIYASAYNGMLLESHIPAHGMCPHHLLPVVYTATIAYIPKGYVIGLSKLTRVAQFYLARPTLQEDVTEELATHLGRMLQTEHVGVKLEGSHMCMTVRGVRNPDPRVVTSALLGAFREDPATRSEFLALANR